MFRVRNALLVFWLCATCFLGYKTAQNPIVFNVLIALCLLAGSQMLGYFVREHLEKLLSYGGKVISLVIFFGLVMAITPHTQADEVLTFNPKVHSFAMHWAAPQAAKAVAPAKNYKDTRLREMAAMWKGTVLEDRTVPLLAMLLVENGALSEKVRGDHGFAIGLEQNHLCRRGFQASGFKKKTYCGATAEAHLAADLKGTKWDGYLTDWRKQFAHYTEVVTGMTNDGQSVDSIIKSWNSKEVGRRAKVRTREADVRAALGL